MLKTAKYDSFSLEDIKSKNITNLQNIIKNFEQAKHVHDSNCQSIIAASGKYRNRLDIIRLEELNKEIKNYDLVLALGGDGTFLRASSFINDQTPILGLNTDFQRSRCAFCTIDKKWYLPNDKGTNGIQNIEILWDLLMKGDFSIKKRSRIEIEIRAFGKKHELNNNLALNEIVISDSEQGRTSQFGLKIDDNPLMRVKGSGLLLSTGILNI